MRSFILAAAAVGALAIPAAPASAQYWGGGYRDYRDREVRQELRECRRELRRADSRREYRRERRECRRELREARRGYRDGYHHVPRGYGYGYGYQHAPRGYAYGYREQYRSYQPRYWDGYRWRYRY
jgi:hypothetical protein